MKIYFFCPPWEYFYRTRMEKVTHTYIFGCKLPRIKMRLVLLVLMIITSTSVLYLFSSYEIGATYPHRQKSTNAKFSYWPRFMNVPAHYDDQNWFRVMCFPQFASSNVAIEELQAVLNFWSRSRNPQCKRILSIFHTIYTLKVRHGQIIIPPAFKNRVSEWLGGRQDLIDEVPHQTIRNIFNEYTFDQTIYNALRSKRPIAKAKEDQRHVLLQRAAASAQNCDFCNYTMRTAMDTFGRLESARGHAYTAANTFKYDGWHSMMMLKQHDPLNFSEEQLVDWFQLAHTWCKKVYSIDSEFRYPVVVWDMTVRGGGSQIHPHIHASIDTDRYYGEMEKIRVGAEKYYKDTGRNYFTDLVSLHSSLGLAVVVGDATAIAPLTPKKDYEIVIMSETPSEDLFRLIYYVTRMYVDVLDVYSYSLSMVLPPLHSSHGSVAGRMPAMVRIVQRGDLTNPRQDISSLEMFTVFNVNSDPTTVVRALRTAVNRHLPHSPVKATSR